MDRREHLCAVLERYGSLAQRVHDGEQVHKQHHRPDLCAPTTAVVEQRETGRKQEDAHQWEGGEAERAPAFGVD